MSRLHQAVLERCCTQHEWTQCACNTVLYTNNALHTFGGSFIAHAVVRGELAICWLSHVAVVYERSDVAIIELKFSIVYCVGVERGIAMCVQFTRGLLIKYNLNTTVLPTSTVQPKMLYVYGFSLPDWTVNLIRVRSATCTLNSRCYTIQCCTVLDTAMLKVSACQWGRTVYELYYIVHHCCL
jgi:hypothetical protein